MKFSSTYKRSVLITTFLWFILQIFYTSVLRAVLHGAGDSWHHLQGAPYVSDHYISLDIDYNSIFFVSFLTCSILARFRSLFCHTVHCCNMIGSGFIWENIKKITSKNLQMIISQRTKVKLKIRHLNDIFFLSNLV